MEQFIVCKEFLTEFEFKDPKHFKINAIVLLCENFRADKKSFCDCFLMGKKMKDWVFDALSNFPIKTTILREKDNPYEVVKPLIGDEDWTIVLFSDTPLITQNTVVEIVEYVTTKNLDFCKLPRGFVVHSKNFLSGNIMLSAEPNFFQNEDFFAVFDFKTLANANDILKNRILNIHLKNKIFIENLNTVSIDALVQIEEGAKILSGNILKGKTKIGKNVLLKENNVIVDSVIEDDCEIFCSVVENFKVKAKTKVLPFSHLKPKGEK